MPRATPEDIQNAATLLKRGEVVAMPTETVYGLAGDAFNETAVKKIFELKQRPFFDPLIVHVAHRSAVNNLVSNVPKAAEILMEAFWPGPLTLVLPKSSKVSSLVTSGLETVGVRMPKHKMALALIEAAGVPLAAPSANLFGRTSPTTAQHVYDEFGLSLTVVDGGPCEVGVESTVVGFEDGGARVAIYRPGAVSGEMMRVVFARAGLMAEVVEKESNVAPGHLKHHYMPKIPVVIAPNNAGDDLAESVSKALKLSEYKPAFLKLSDDPAIAARELYARLRDCAESGANVIIVEKPSNTVSDLWAAIWNRLEKAATLNLG